VFEAATIVGVPLFELEPSRLAPNIARTEERLALLPKKIRSSKIEIDDEF
jgi:hypothetical protein